MTYYYEGVDKVAAAVAETMAAGDALFVKAGVTVGSSDSHVGVSGSGASCLLTVYGTLMSMGNSAFDGLAGGHLVTIGTGGAMSGSNVAGSAFSAGDGNNFITNAGSMTGSFGIFITAATIGQNHVVNSGTIAAITTAASIGGGFNTIFNSGSITSTFQAAIITGGSSQITNTGTIAATNDVAIAYSGAAGSGVDVLDNSGTISGSALFGPAITGGDNGLSVNNSGHINGSIIFGAAADFYDGEAGTLVSGSIIGQGGDDIITGGAGRTIINGGAGSDTVDGGAGRDIFRALHVSDSDGAVHDTILGVDARKDKFDFSVNVTGVDATVATGVLTTANFATDVKNAVGAAQLAAHHAVLFTATSGDLAGHTILVVDANGNAGFQTGNKDFVFDLTDADNLGNLGRGDFI